MANPPASSSRTPLWIAVALAVAVAGYLIFSSGDSAMPPGVPEASREGMAPGATTPPSAEVADRRSDAWPEEEIVETETEGELVPSTDGRETRAAASERADTADEVRDQAIEEVRVAIRTEPDRAATEAFRDRVAAPPPTTPDWVIDAIEEGPPPVPAEIEEQIAQGKPEVPADIQDAIERTLRDGPPPTPPEMQRAIDEAQR